MVSFIGFSRFGWVKLYPGPFFMENELRLGAVGYMATRFAQIVGIPAVVLGVALVVPLVEPLPALFVTLWAVFFLVAVLSHWNVAMITACDEGIRVRRISGEHLVPWSDIREIQYSVWQSPRLRIVL